MHVLPLYLLFPVSDALLDHSVSEYISAAMVTTPDGSPAPPAITSTEKTLDGMRFDIAPRCND